MNMSMLVIACSIIIISIIIYYVKNYKEILNQIGKLNHKKIFKIVKIITYIIIILGVIFLIYKEVMNIYNNVKFYKKFQENNNIFDESDSKILEESQTYKELINLEYQNQDPTNPYIPEGFYYVEGEWNTGFVIQDEKGNEYVWVPCSNVESDEIVKLQKRNFSEYSAEIVVSKDTCYNDKYEEFIKSSLENGGFYISRYEIGNENNTPVSKLGVEVYGNISKNEALELINNMYENINCELINGYAYDTTLAWLQKNNDITFNKIDLRENSKIYSGRNKINNLYDFTDNMLEFSLENCYDTVVIRGFAYEEDIEGRSRYTILEDDNFFDYMSLITLRTVIYK